VVKKEIFMAAMSADFLREVQLVVQGMSNQFEQSLGVVVTDAARNFMRDMLIESAIYRGDGWLREHGIRVNDAQQLLDIAKYSQGPIDALLSQSRPVIVNSTKYICMASLVEGVHKQWCGVWPFCRR
jgi:hypothetical protein